MFADLDYVLGWIELIESYFWGVVDLIAEGLLRQPSELSLKGSHDHLFSSLLDQIVDLDYQDQLVD